MSFLSRIFGARNPPAPKIVAHVAFGGAVRVIEAPTEDGLEYAEDATPTGRNRSASRVEYTTVESVLPHQFFDTEKLSRERGMKAE